jgi:hypothetical protein
MRWKGRSAQLGRRWMVVRSTGGRSVKLTRGRSGAGRGRCKTVRRVQTGGGLARTSPRGACGRSGPGLPRSVNGGRDGGRRRRSGTPLRHTRSLWRTSRLARGQSRSVQAGLAALQAVESHLGAVIFLLADQPGVTPELLSALVQRHRETLARGGRPATMANAATRSSSTGPPSTSSPPWPATWGPARLSPRTPRRSPGWICRRPMCWWI